MRGGARLRTSFATNYSKERRSSGARSLRSGQRRRYRGMQASLLEHLAAKAPLDEALEHLEKLLEIAPFDTRAHQSLLTALVASGRLRDGEKHLETAARSFEEEGLESRPLIEAWKTARAKGQTAEVRASTSPALPALEPDALVPLAGQRRASIAVMPFADNTFRDGPRGGIADALVHDVITRIAKLRSLFVIAQGTVFALDHKQIVPHAAGRILNVDYIVSGWISRRGNRASVSVELAETRTARIVWADVLTPKVEDVLGLLDEIGDRIVASVASEIEANERNRAVLQPPASLDAWQAYHRGLWHMYRFTHADNELARQFFQMAVRLDPTFARAYAGLSFTHWQSAFQGWADRTQEAECAYAAASQSLMADDRDPAAHWAMARALWLRGRTDGSILELGQSVTLSPNFALAHYNLAFVHGTSGDAAAADLLIIHAISVPSTRCCSVCWAHEPWCWCAWDGSRRRRSSGSRPPRDPMRSRISAASQRCPRRSPDGWATGVRNSKQSIAQTPRIASTTI